MGAECVGQSGSLRLDRGVGSLDMGPTAQKKVMFVVPYDAEMFRMKDT